MRNKVLFSDKIQGNTFIEKGRDKYFKTKDSSSPSGHSLVAQIEMTHSGIITKNYGFYLPWKMRDGAKSFTNDFHKPVIVGHDEDPFKPAEPVGRVIQADYIDTSREYKQKDSYLRSLFDFVDRKKGKAGKHEVEFANHVIQDLIENDNYRGLGHIRGTFKITDEETIAKILDQRYLTVSTSMASDSAKCSVCGEDWVTDGQCEHQRGGVYEDKTMVLIPGDMWYDHVGIVNNPADPHAAGFKVVGEHEVKDSTISEKAHVHQYLDSIEMAANLFAWNDKNLYSLSTKDEVDLIEVKDNIQKMEKAMGKKTTSKDLHQQILDGVRISTCVYSYGEEEGKEMTVSQYAESLSEVDLQKLVSDIETVMQANDGYKVEEAIQTHFSDTVHKGDGDAYGKTASKKKKSKKKAKKVKKMDSFKLTDAGELSEESVEQKALEIKDWIETQEELKVTDAQAKKLAEIAALIEAEDAITVLNYGDKFEAEKVLDKLTQDGQKLAELSQEQFLDMLNEHMPEDTKFANGEDLRASDFCGKKGFFPVIDRNTYLASKAVLAEVQAADSIKGRILGAMDKRAEKLELSLEDSFDSNDEPCDNNEVSTEELIKTYEDAKAKLTELGHEFEDSVSQDSTAEEEISLLEAQLEAANEEVEVLYGQVKEVKDQLSEQLAIRLVDLKTISQGFEVEDRAKAIEEHKARSLESLKDSIQDLASQVDLTSLPQVEIKDGSGSIEEKDSTVENPVLSEDETKKKKTHSQKDKGGDDKEFDKNKMYDQYNYYVRRYGKVRADQWLDKVQKKNGFKPSLD
jgi:hypothetical protein